MPGYEDPGEGRKAAGVKVVELLCRCDSAQRWGRPEADPIVPRALFPLRAGRKI
jgi:hypothetical protein